MFDRHPRHAGYGQALAYPCVLPVCLDTAAAQAYLGGVPSVVPDGDVSQGEVPETMSELLIADRLSKTFGSLAAVTDVSFTVGRGEVVGFLGPNGAGKTTTMRMLAGFIAPTAGRALINGHDVGGDPLAARAALGYLPEGAPLYETMTPAELLAFTARVRGLTGAAFAARRDEVVGRLGLEAVLYRPVETLSKGFRRRVGLALAILHDPDVIILDEPTDGLDPNQKHEVRGLIRDIAREKAIIISTHILEEVAPLCTRALIIAGGSVVVDEAADAFMARGPLEETFRALTREAA